MRILLNFSKKNYQKNLFYQSSIAEAATQTDVSGFSVNGHDNSIGELNETVEKLSRELKHLQCRLEHKFDIEKYKDSPKDIAVYIGFHDYETLLLCYSLLEDTAKSINYGSYTKLANDNKLCRPRKLSCFNEFILVCMKLRLGLFNGDIGHRFIVCESTVPLTFRTWIRLSRVELEPTEHCIDNRLYRV